MVSVGELSIKRTSRRVGTATWFADLTSDNVLNIRNIISLAKDRARGNFKKCLAFRSPNSFCLLNLKINFNFVQLLAKYARANRE